jgi:hypothetical protein
MTTTIRRQRCRQTLGHEGADLPGRQVTWTRLGNGMGYTNTEAKLAEIRTELERMVWRDPSELADLLDVAPTRQVIPFLLGGRRWALHRAAVATLPPTDPLRGERRLLALESVSGERYLLLDDCGYEWIHVYTDRPVYEEVAASR